MSTTRRSSCTGRGVDSVAAPPREFSRLSVLSRAHGVVHPKETPSHAPSRAPSYAPSQASSMTARAPSHATSRASSSVSQALSYQPSKSAHGRSHRGSHADQLLGGDLRLISMARKEKDQEESNVSHTPRARSQTSTRHEPPSMRGRSRTLERGVHLNDDLEAERSRYAASQTPSSRSRAPSMSRDSAAPSRRPSVSDSRNSRSLHVVEYFGCRPAGSTASIWEAKQAARQAEINSRRRLSQDTLRPEDSASNFPTIRSSVVSYAPSHVSRQSRHVSVSPASGSTNSDILELAQMQDEAMQMMQATSIAPSTRSSRIRSGSVYGGAMMRDGAGVFMIPMGPPLPPSSRGGRAAAQVSAHYREGYIDEVNGQAGCREFHHRERHKPELEVEPILPPNYRKSTRKYRLGKASLSDSSDSDSDSSS